MNGTGLYERIKGELALPPDFKEVLEQPLTALGYNIVSHDDVLDYDDVPLSHNCAQAHGRNVALLHLSKEVLSSDDTWSHVVLLGIQFSKKVASLFFFTQSNDFSDLRYNQKIANKWKSDSPGLCEARFFRYEIIEHLKGLSPEGRKSFLSDLLALSRLQAPTPPPAPPPGGGGTNSPQVDDGEDEPEVEAMLEQQYINALVKIMERKAVSVPNITPAQYLRNVVEGAVIPTLLKNSMLNLTGNARIDAQNILKAANSQQRNTADDKSTVIGSLLQPLLTPEEIDPDDQRVVAGIIYYNRLLRDDDELRALALRFQIPDPAPPARPDVPPRGPAFTPHVEAIDTKVLQGFFSREPPDMQDVGTMKLALKRTSAVCRVEIPGGRFGTGFLIAPRLVLTNYHVLNLEGRETQEQTLENALQAGLRFGFISAERGREEKGQVFKLDRQNPIVDWSPIPLLDFALLRVEEPINEAQDIEPVKYSLNVPTPNATLNMIQHPEGQVMKIALSGNAVTWLSDDHRLIQYVTPAAAGSSGSPCFDDDWNVVAIHHAEETRRFAGFIDAGTVREGILFGEIYKQIKAHLR
jgi:V8-like Glu-specific endopeptidase